MQDGQIGIISAFAAGSLCGMRMANETEYMVFGKSKFSPTIHDFTVGFRSPWLLWSLL